MARGKYQIYPPVEDHFPEVSSQVSSPGGHSTVDFGKVVVVLIVILVVVGLLYLSYSLFIKDCILLFKAKKQRTTTEIGFGNTPARGSSDPPHP
ncbi:movement protein [Chickpea yellows virus]|uniref:Movement protein n=1 Tax=Chickpea yellows virus TaxID=1162557 RepID=H9BAI4_9GEMI|nr:movement protein [Chickpea yellows virus]AFD63065.1 movement protein [Chickpea yellows virus]